MDNFDLKKYLAEGKLYEAINLDIEDDIAILSGDSGEYEGEIEDGKTSFSVIYDDLDYRISDRYDESNIEDFLGRGHAFVELAKKYDHNWDVERDLVGITIKLKDLAEGKLLKEVMDEEMVDYVSAMYDSDVDQEAEEGFQSDVWSKAEYASNAYDESSIFLELIDHLKSVGGKDVVEGNPDIKLELLPNGDIRWSANVTFD